MKKKIFISMIIVIMCFGVLIYTNSSISGSVMINNLKGDVEIKGESSFLGIFSFADWKDLSSDYDLEPGDIIRTGDDGSLEIAFNDSIYVKVDNNTEVVIGENQITESSSSRSINLNSGRIWAKVVRIYNELTDFEVITPGAIAGVRGTLFSVYSDGEETIVSVKEGTVELSSSDRQSNQLINRQQMGVAADGRVQLENTISEPENNRWKNRDIDEWMEKIEEADSRGKGNNNGNGNPNNGNPGNNGNNNGNNNPGNGNPGNNGNNNPGSGNPNNDQNDVEQDNDDQGNDGQSGGDQGQDNDGQSDRDRGDDEQDNGNSGNSNSGNNNPGKNPGNPPNKNE
ncbi:MAG: FecR domain-containing protein [Halanaerobiales bacterium]